MRDKPMYAGVMELADVLDSKSSPGNRVRVRPPPPAPNQKTVANADYPVFATVFLNSIVPSYCYKFICISIF